MHPVIITDHGWRDELITHVGGVGCVQRLAHSFGMFALGADHGTEGTLHPVPAIVAVHRPVAPDHGDDARPIGQRGLEGGQAAVGIPWRRVAPVGDGMHGNLEASAGQHPRGGENVAFMTVDAAL